MIFLLRKVIKFWLIMQYNDFTIYSRVRRTNWLSIEKPTQKNKHTTLSLSSSSYTQIPSYIYTHCTSRTVRNKRALNTFFSWLMWQLKTMADQQDFIGISLSACLGENVYGFRNGDVLGSPEEVLNKKLLIDLTKLSIGSMISEGPYSVVYEGL